MALLKRVSQNAINAYHIIALANTINTNQSITALNYSTFRSKIEIMLWKEIRVKNYRAR